MNKLIVSAGILLTLTAVASATHKREALLATVGESGTPTNIEKVIAGKSCVAPDGDVLSFGTSGTFEHAGHPSAVYRIGYATLLIVRAGELHSHVATVNPVKRIMHFSAGKYQC